MYELKSYKVTSAIAYYSKEGVEATKCYDIKNGVYQDGQFVMNQYYTKAYDPKGALLKYTDDEYPYFKIKEDNLYKDDQCICAKINVNNRTIVIEFIVYEVNEINISDKSFDTIKNSINN